MNIKIEATSQVLAERFDVTQLFLDITNSLPEATDLIRLTFNSQAESKTQLAVRAEAMTSTRQEAEAWKIRLQDLGYTGVRLSIGEKMELNKVFFFLDLNPKLRVGK